MRRISAFAIAAALAVTSTTAVAALRDHHWMGSVSGKNGSKATGTGTMTAGKEAGTTEVTLELKGDAANATHPWHIHVGSCEKGSGIWGGAGSYAPITVDAQGNGKSMATIKAALPDTGSYYVNIHESRENMRNIVACGDLMKM